MDKKNYDCEKGELMLRAIGNIDESLISEAHRVRKKNIIYRIMPIAAAVLVIALCIAPVFNMLRSSFPELGNGKNEDPYLPGFDYSQNETPQAPSDGTDDTLRGDSYLRIMSGAEESSGDLTLTDVKENEAFLPIKDGKIYIKSVSELKIERAEYILDGGLYIIAATDDFEVTAADGTLVFKFTDGGYLVKLS